MAICLFLKNQLLIDNFHIFPQSNVNQQGCLPHFWQTHAIAEHVCMGQVAGVRVDSEMAGQMAGHVQCKTIHDWLYT